MADFEFSDASPNSEVASPNFFTWNGLSNEGRKAYHSLAKVTNIILNLMKQSVHQFRFP